MKKLIALILMGGIAVGAVLLIQYYGKDSEGRVNYSPVSVDSETHENNSPDKSAELEDEKKDKGDSPTNSNPVFYEILGQSNRLTRAQQMSILSWRSDMRVLAQNHVGQIFLNGPDNDKCVALTFDDGPEACFTPQILDILKEYQTKGNFFFSGSRVGTFPEVVKRAYNEGNLVLNHTQNHLSLDKKTPAIINEEVLMTDQAIYNITGQHPALVRPPYGAVNITVIDELIKTQNTIIIWSIDTLDWSQKEANNIAKNVLDNVRPGDIILMHSNEDREATAQALPLIISGLQQKGYQIVGLDELLHINAYK